MSRTLLSPLTVASLPILVLGLACGDPAGGGQVTPDYVVPTVAEIAASGTATDAPLNEVDRAAELAEATDAPLASTGAPLDFAAAPHGFRLDVQSAEPAPSTPASGSGSYTNVVHAAAMVLSADASTAIVLSIPSAAIAVTLAGPSAQIAPNVWASTNTVTIHDDTGNHSVTGLFVLAWVDVGWIAQLRITDAASGYDNTPWLNGFVSADRQVGWWDMVDRDGNAVGALEWADDGAGDGEFGIAGVSNGAVGNVLVYAAQDGEAAVGYHDAGAAAGAQDYSVDVLADGSGSLVDPQYNAGSSACWDTSREDAACE